MRVLYICTGNSFRSPIAEALTRKHRSDLEVESAGTDSASHIASSAKLLLEQEDALEYVKPASEQVSQRALDEADKVVCMMPMHKEYILDNFDISEDKIEVWKIKDPIKPEKGAFPAFREIEEKVKELG